MKYIIKCLITEGKVIHLGRYLFLNYGDGTTAVRQDQTGLMSPDEKSTCAGLKRLLAWIDKEEWL